MLLKGKKVKQHKLLFSLLVPHFPRHICFAICLSKSISCTTYASPRTRWSCLMRHKLEIRGWAGIKQAPSSTDAACEWLVTRMAPKFAHLLKGWMTAISAQLMAWHLCNLVDISIWWMTENGLEFSLLWSYMHQYELQCKFPPPPPFTQTGLTADL